MFAVLIISHKRPHNVVTVDTLRKCGYTGDIYIVCDDEDETLPEYIEKFGKEYVKVFHKDNTVTDMADNLKDFKGVSVYARNAALEFARELKLKNFLMLDDDYTSFDMRVEYDNKLKSYKVKDLDRIFKMMCEFLNCSPHLYCLAWGTMGDFVAGKDNQRVHEGLYFNARNTYFCSTEKTFKYLGRIMEDVTTPAVYNNLGQYFITVLRFQVGMIQRENNTGGILDAYQDLNLYWQYFYPIIFQPSAVSMTKKGDVFNKRLDNERLIPKLVSARWKK